MSSSSSSSAGASGGSAPVAPQTPQTPLPDDKQPSGEDYIEAIEQCKSMKLKYDRCFNTWYSSIF